MGHTLNPALAAGERAAFHGRPAAGLAPLRKVLAGHPEPPRVRWLQGVCLGALGRYVEAAAVLGPALAADPLAATARASHLRQLERHAEAEDLDRAALRLAAAGSEAWADALIGLVADAGWRPPVRLAWVRAEVALLCGRPEDAARHAADAVRRSAAAGAPRHLAKSLLFRGVAEEVLGDKAAAATLDLAARAAEDLGLLPLVWPARLMRSRILSVAEPETAQSDLAAARAAMRAIAVGLPEDDSMALLTRTG